MKSLKIPQRRSVVPFYTLLKTPGNLWFVMCTVGVEKKHWTETGSKNLMYYPFKRQPPKMVKHTQTVREKQLTNCLSVFDHFVGLALKRVKATYIII